jgi:nicotinamidase-related amidase
MQQAKVSDPAQLPARTVEGTRGWEVVDELKPQAGDIVFKKRRPSAFIATDLDLILRNRDIRTVVLTGGSTEGGN